MCVDFSCSIRVDGGYHTLLDKFFVVIIVFSTPKSPAQNRYDSFAAMQVILRAILYSDVLGYISHTA